jgi:alanine racemase
LLVRDNISPETLFEAGARLSVNLANLKSNYRMLANQAGESNCAAVVKANAYGMGLDACVAAFLEAGADTFFVAQIAEARRVREIAPSATIYVLSGIPEGSARLFAEMNIRPVLSCFEEAEEWENLCRRDRQRRPAAIHIDTGINRLGIAPIDVAAFASEFGDSPDFEISLLMSHFACADEPGHPLNKTQIERFDMAREAFPGIPASLANSAALLWSRDARSRIEFDLARPGIALYGSAARGDIVNPMMTVATLEARVIQVRQVDAGESIGYGATFTTKRASRIAILSTGYADGYQRGLGNGGDNPIAMAAVGQKRVPIVGRVSMDLIAIDVTDLPPDAVSRGTMIELFGNTISIDEVAAWSGTIAYELLTQLGPRLYRDYDEAID